LNFMNDLTACSAPLLFQGTPDQRQLFFPVSDH
jgi:hypothetical protein